MSSVIPDEVHAYQSLFISKFKELGNEYSLVQEQFTIHNLRLDALGYNSKHERLVVIELKSDIATNKAFFQAYNYSQSIKNIQVDNLIISSSPEIILVAPDFKITTELVTDFSCRFFKLNQYNSSLEEFFLPAHNPIKRKLASKSPTTVFVSSYMQSIINTIINVTNSWYNYTLTVIDNGSTIDVLNDKLLLKFSFSKKWFQDSCSLMISDRLIKPFSYNLFVNDYAVKKVVQLKHGIRITFNELPEYFK